MTAELTGSGPAHSPVEDRPGGRAWLAAPGVHQLTDTQWQDLKDVEDSQRTEPALQDDDQHRWWVSWWHLCGLGEFELTSPWWISGFRDSGDGSDADSICAAVLAATPDAAREVVLSSYDVRPAALGWRFVEQMPADWSPFCDRFPQADWMGWPGDAGADGDVCTHGVAVQDCQTCEEAAITAGDAPPLTCERCGRSVTRLVADDYELICEGCAGGHTLDEAAVAVCDNASVGVVIHDAVQDRWLMFERGRVPVGVAPVAGHVWDDHATADAVPEEAYRAAARAEVAEELGLSVVDLIDAGVGGWRPNRCRRPGGRRGVGHYWRIYSATMTGDLAPASDEARHPRWLTRGQLQELADRTVTYARGALAEDAWTARPGIEPVWVSWLVQLGLVEVAQPDLALIDQVAAGHPVIRVVFGAEIGEGTVVLEPCRGPRLCTVETGRHCESASYNDPERDFHRLTVLRLRPGLTAVVADQDGVEQPWRTSPATPVRVRAATLPVPPGDAVAGREPILQDAWLGMPVDPRWDPYRLRMSGPRVWRPWWVASVEYLGAWRTHGDQRIISVRSRSRAGALVEALDALVDHCQWLAEGPHADLDLVPVVWLGAQLVPVSHLAGQAAGGGDR